MGQFTLEKGTDLSKVNPQLLDIVKNAIAAMPYDAIITSGMENRGSGELGNHGPGYAVDVAFIGPDGKRIGNTGARGGAAAAPVYEQYAQIARAYQMKTYPKLADTFRWGGGFLSGGTPFDYMHLDITPGAKGAMAYYDWNTGWKPGAYQAMPGLKQVALVPFGQSGGKLQISGPATLTADAPIPLPRPVTAATAAIDAVAGNVTPPSLLGYTGTGTAPATRGITSYTPPAPWAALAAQAAPAAQGPSSPGSLIGNLFKAATGALANVGQPATPVADGQIRVEPFSSASLAGIPAPAPAAPQTAVQAIQAQYPQNVTLSVPLPSLLKDVRKANPMAGLISDTALTAKVMEGLPPYMRYNPTTGDMTVVGAGSADVQQKMAALAQDKKLGPILKPYIDNVQAGVKTPLPLPREARPSAPAPTPAPTYTPPTPWGTLAAQAKPAPAPAPAPAKPYTPPTPWGALAQAAPTATKPTTPVVSPWSAMAAAGPMSLPPAAPAAPFVAADPLGSVARAWSANPAAMAAAVAPRPRPVAPLPPPPPPVTWTTSSRIASAAPVPATRGATPQAKGGLLSFGGFGGFLGSILQQGLKQGMSPAPRGQFGQPLGVGGIYRNGAVWAADGSGYGGSPGQSTAGLKTGERVYDPNTGEWGLKVGQPVTWTRTGNSVDGSSAGSNTSGGGSTSGATGTFKGTSTGNTYTVGNTYVNGNGTYQAMPDGTFKRV